MSFTWDENKNRSNLAKHGIDFETATTIFEGDVITAEDCRCDYGEVRKISIGESRGGLVIVVVHTKRSGSTRMISARLASTKEREIYYGFTKKEY